MRLSCVLRMVRSLYGMMMTVLATHMVAALGRGSINQRLRQQQNDPGYMYPLRDERTMQSNGNDKSADGVDRSQSAGLTMTSGPLSDGDPMTIAMPSVCSADTPIILVRGRRSAAMS